MLEEDYGFQCPHCGAEISIRLDSTAGKRQAFSYDCEVCCRPIQIVAEFDGDEVTGFSAEAES